MAWTGFATWAVGQISLASDWNTYVAANMNFLATPPILRVRRNAAYTAVASTTTTFPFDTTVVDSASGFSNSTHEYTVPVAGSYWISSVLTQEIGATTGRLYMSATTSFGEELRGLDLDAVTTSINLSSCVSGLLIGLTVGQVVYIQYFATQAVAFEVGALELAWMTMVKVSN